MNPARLKAYILLLIVGVIWGIAGPVIKLTLGEIDPAPFLLYRFLISSLIALPALIKGFRYLKTPGLFLIIVYALLNSTATLGLLFWGTDNTTLLDMSLISLTGPILMMLLGYLFLGDKITRREKIGTSIALVGSLVIALEPIASNDHGGERLFGNILIILSLVCGAISGYLAKKLLREGFSPVFLTNISFVVGFVSLIPIVFSITSMSELSSTFYNLPLEGHLGILYMAIFSGTVAYTLNNMGQKTIELSEAALFSYLHPIISATIAVVFLGDALSTQIILGGTVAAVGVVIAEVKKKSYN